MIYVITARATFGIPMIIEEKDAVSAINKAILGDVQKGTPFFETLLPSTQWSVEPLETISAIASLRDALKGMQAIVAELGNELYDDPRVQAGYVAMNDSADVIEKIRIIQEELYAGNQTGSGSDGTGQEEKI